MRIARLVALVAVFVGAVTAGGGVDAARFPDRIDLPPGYRPEGIAVGRGSTFYVGSLANGGLYRGDLATGAGDVINAGADGATTVGLTVDQRERVFAAGGPTGEARVFDGRTGDLLKVYQLTTGSAFVNDVVVAGDSAWFTDSVNPVLYRVPLDLGPAETIPLTGDLVYTSGFNVNGIDATPDGDTLVLVQSNTGQLFTADTSGVTTAIDLGGETVRNGDGILLEGRTLYVLQNRMNQLAVVALSPDLSSGEVVTRVSDVGFDVPTTLDRFGSRLYAVNARFNTPPTGATAYWVTGLPRP